MKIPRFLEKGWEGVPLLIIVTMLNAATFWPLAYDFFDYLSGLFGYDSHYASFHAMPNVFWVAWFIFALLVGSIAFKLTLSIVSILASWSHYGNGDIANPNTVTAEFNDENKKHYSTMANISVVFVISFLMALYQLNIRLEHIQSENAFKALKNNYEIHEKQFQRFINPLVR